MNIYSARLSVRSISHLHRVSCDWKDERYTGSEGVEEPPNSIVAHTKERCLPFSSLVEHRSNIDCRNDVSLPADRSVSLIPVYARKILRISAHTRSIDRSIVGFNSKKHTRTDRSIRLWRSAFLGWRVQRAITITAFSLIEQEWRCLTRWS